MNEANVTRRTLSVLVENAAGVLSQVSRLFSRKGYNIESLAVGTTDAPAVSRITIEVWAVGYNSNFIFSINMKFTFLSFFNCINIILNFL